MWKPTRREVAGLSKDRQLLLVAMVGFFLSGFYYYGPITCHGLLLMFLVLHIFIYIHVYGVYLHVCTA